MQYIVSDFSSTVEVPETGIMREEDSVEIPGYLKDIEKILITENCIKARLRGIANEINKRYSDKDIHCVVVLSGAIVFFADLMRALSRHGFKVTYSLIKLSSYSKAKSTGKIAVEMDIGRVEGKDVVVIEDIADTGLTLDHLRNHLLNEKKAKSVKVCVLFNKMTKKTAEVNLDFIGFKVPDQFIVGYGLDFDQRYRELPFVAVLKS
ncbi:hypoxanthine phosphoribosyltransferase [Candidatus Woesearchaeota archaeon]|nr:hypoxanthine phosphoribosyltransferase [Candidatus Woesearchaeota archaeon]